MLFAERYVGILRDERGKGDAHLYVFKEGQGDAVNTKIRRLDGESRIVAIAKMLSGEKPTAAAMENARELVN